MARLVLLPQLGISDESAVVSSFRVKKGDTVRSGAPLFAIETGKSVFEVASETDGVVLAILCDEGDELPVKAPVMAIGQAGEVYEGEAEPNAEASAPLSADPPRDAERALASPRARTLANKAGVDAGRASATGPEGLIIERDIQKLLNEGGSRAAPAPKAAEPIKETVPIESTPTIDYIDAPMSAMRRIIAKNMSASLANAAQLTHSSSFDAAEILAYRARCKNDDIMKGVTLGDMVLFAVSRTLAQFPDMNAHVMGETIRRFSGVHLAVAIDIPGGLVVPVIRDAHRKSLLEISNETKVLAKQSREGTLPPEKLDGGTFTVSNLGSLGVERFTPIINPPQAGILGVNNITLRPRRKPDGTVEFYDAFSLSLTYDHRAVDGAPASRFLKAVCDNLAAFTLLLGR
ncbi:MAG: 2-oxo acid dehydrogenase subunit E2 [Oscillospiraceae bacterium]|jgi:pyruvate dehydrogenase E2 component (dihydrolipoamide acetyltransferase)|nr:2-oxo acid dehydrogenase subunit E2 [Oscillospiraceae bacterium]